MNEEYLLERKFGRPRPFKVPEGYFERLESEVVSRVAGRMVKKRHAVMRIWRPLSLAAGIAAAVIVCAVYFNKVTTGRVSSANTILDDMSPSVYSDYLIDEMSDYAMLDNDDLYSLMEDE